MHLPDQPRGPADPRQHPPLPPGRLDLLADRHPPIRPAAFRKLDAVAVLTGPSLPVPLFRNLGCGTVPRRGRPGPRNYPPAVPEVVPQHAFLNDRSELNYGVLCAWDLAPASLAHRSPMCPGSGACDDGPVRVLIRLRAAQRGELAGIPPSSHGESTDRVTLTLPDRLPLPDTRSSAVPTGRGLIPCLVARDAPSPTWDSAVSFGRTWRGARLEAGGGDAGPCCRAG